MWMLVYQLNGLGDRFGEGSFIIGEQRGAGQTSLVWNPPKNADLMASPDLGRYRDCLIKVTKNS